MNLRSSLKIMDIDYLGSQYSNVCHEFIANLFKKVQPIFINQRIHFEQSFFLNGFILIAFIGLYGMTDRQNKQDLPGFAISYIWLGIEYFNIEVTSYSFSEGLFSLLISCHATE
ncbi:hypothetical protein COJ46_22080 [Bacillus sp. AFS077874]|uniref:hypothetical protein n=1 Tax=Bacillus sp. AFS077874 TaxID=2033513 RepID=UPI000BF5D40A|nr:hypothetical protein [Bacillus sp. AFS077874]PFM75244.1 hypothetical protein COJ46_22080 [Bacillus sp. AFS077874]